MIDPDEMEGRWIHSHEEATDDEMVFRSASSGHAFPRARGREAFELRPDGFYTGTAPGPADKPEPNQGRWNFQGGDRLALGDRVLEITVADGEAQGPPAKAEAMSRRELQEAVARVQYVFHGSSGSSDADTRAAMAARVVAACELCGSAGRSLKA
jgi:hypothetical protein